MINLMHLTYLAMANCFGLFFAVVGSETTECMCLCVCMTERHERWRPKYAYSVSQE